MENSYETRGEVTAILLSRKDGEVIETLIDTTDLERVLSHPNKWYFGGKYVISNKPRKGKYRKGRPSVGGGTIPLTRWILGVDDKVIHIDHLNHNPLDNRRINLRETTVAENAQNRKGPQKNSLTGIRGVTWNKEKKKWQARVRINGIERHLGWFNTAEEADQKAKEARSIYMPFSIEARAVNS